MFLLCYDAIKKMRSKRLLPERALRLKRLLFPPTLFKVIAPVIQALRVRVQFIPTRRLQVPEHLHQTPRHRRALSQALFRVLIALLALQERARLLRASRLQVFVHREQHRRRRHGAGDARAGFGVRLASRRRACRGLQSGARRPCGRGLLPCRAPPVPSSLLQRYTAGDVRLGARGPPASRRQCQSSGGPWTKTANRSPPGCGPPSDESGEGRTAILTMSFAVLPLNSVKRWNLD